MLTWKEVFEKYELIGGDIETQEDGKVYRAPISRVRMEDGKLIINSDWCAVLRDSATTDGKMWEKWDNNQPMVLDEEFGAAPQDIGNGRFLFTLIAMGQGTIFTKENGSKLDPEKVAGLKLTST